MERNVSDINILSYPLKGEIFHRFCAPPQERPVVVETTNSVKQNALSFVFEPTLLSLFLFSALHACYL